MLITFIFNISSTAYFCSLPHSSHHSLDERGVYSKTKMISELNRVFPMCGQHEVPSRQLYAGNNFSLCHPHRSVPTPACGYLLLTQGQVNRKSDLFHFCSADCVVGITCNSGDSSAGQKVSS